MATLSAGKWSYSEVELETMFRTADKRGKDRLRKEPRAARAEYDANSRRMVIEIVNGCTLMVPVDVMQGLRGATDEELADFELKPRGFDLHWKTLDAQFSVAGLLAGVFGTKSWMAKLDDSRGRSTSHVTPSPARPSQVKDRRHQRTVNTSKTAKRRNSAA